VVRGEKLERRVLEAVGRTLYTEGINATGVDRLCQMAGVSKRTLYQHFQSKDELVARALASNDQLFVDLLVAPGVAAAEAGADEASQILAVFEGVADLVVTNGFRGCPFLNASVEIADRQHPARAVAAAHKNNMRAWFEETARRGGLPSPETLSRQLMIVLDGIYIDAVIHPPHVVAHDALEIARALLEHTQPKKRS
jgi:AcrR family transcriptional regulator